MCRRFSTGLFWRGGAQAFVLTIVAGVFFCAGGKGMAQPAVLPSILPATQPGTPATQPATQPAEWEKIEQQWQTVHTFRHAKAFWTADSGNLQRAEEFLVHLRELCIAGRGREAVQGALPNYQATAPGIPLNDPFKPFNFIRLTRMMEIHRNVNELKKDLGDDDYEYLSCLYWLSFAYRSCDDYGDQEAAERWATEACDTLGRILQGKPHPVYAACLDELASDKIGLSKLDEAEALLKQAMGVAVASLGPDSAIAARIQNDLGTLYQRTGRYPQASQCYQQARRMIEVIAARESDVGDQIMHARIMQNLGLLAGSQGDYERNKQCLLQSLAEHNAINARLGGKNALRRAECLLYLGAIPLTRPRGAAEDLDEAEKYLTEAKTVYEKEMGNEHPETARVWMLLGELYLLRGDRARGDPEAGARLIRMAMSVYERSGDRNEIDRISRLMTLVGMSVSVGDYDKALMQARQALEVTRVVFGASPPQMAERLEYVGQIQEQLGQLDEADKNLGDALAMARGNLDLSFAAQTEEEQLRMTQMYRAFVDGWLSFRLRHGLKDAEMWAQVLSWKGTVFARQHAIREARRSASPSVLALFKELEADTRQVQALSYQRAMNPSPDRDADAKIASLREKTEQLQEDLSRQSAAFAEQRALSRATPADIQRLLPSGAALVDFLRYADLHAPAGGRGLWVSEEHYVAFVVTAQRITAVPLGPAAPIEQMIERWRAHEMFPLAEGLKLRGMVWDKLERALGGARLVLISPDGPLATLPFAALPADKEGATYLIERVALAIVPVPQMLPSLLAQRPRPSRTKSAALLVGAVNFDAEGQASAKGKLNREADSLQVASALAPRGSTDGHWAPLPGAADEIRHVIGIFNQAAPDVRTQPLEGAEANKAGFIEALEGKEYLHVATHAFFAARGIHSVVAPAESAIGRQGASTDQGPTGIDPGLLSGFVLAGANRPLRVDAAGKPLSDDGILTALEVSRMDLSTLRVAVLSACETAVGAAAGGEGVFGLQRAFQLAGARTVLASLWKVDDRKTSELMTDFYEGLLARHQSPMIALRQAQLRVLAGAKSGAGPRRSFVQDEPETATSRSPKLSPSLWAAWVLSGDPGELTETLESLKHENDPAPVAAVALPAPAADPKPRSPWLSASLAVAALAVVLALAGMLRRRQGR